LVSRLFDFGGSNKKIENAASNTQVGQFESVIKLIPLFVLDRIAVLNILINQSQN
jgi:hypothetical protein